jgi:hypothetical protein
MEIRMKKLVACLLPLAAACALPALAHHSGAMFDSTRTQTITGKIVEFNWVNPHSSFKVEVTGADGKTEIWAIEMNAPGNLVRSGWKRTTLKKGDQVTAVVRPLRDGKPGGSYVSIKLADGTVLDGQGQGPGENYTAPAQPAPAQPAR